MSKLQNYHTQQSNEQSNSTSNAISNLPSLSSSSSPNVAAPFDYHSIRFGDLHGVKFYTAMPLVTCISRALVYPLTLIKTRMQAPNCEYKSTVDAFRTIRRTTGVRSLYKGFSMNLIGVAIGPIYISTLEHSRAIISTWHQQHYHNQNIDALSYELPPSFTNTHNHNIITQSTSSSSSSSSHSSPPLTQPAPPSLSSTSSSSYSPSSSPSSYFSHFIPFISGFLASSVAQVFGVPLDIVAQKVMIERRSGADAATGKLVREIITNTWRESGVRGFYRGYVVSFMTSAPFSSVMWGSFTYIHPLYRECIHRAHAALAFEPRSTPARFIKWDVFEFIALPLSSFSSGCLAAVLTTPFDLVKTRVQVEADRRITPLQTVRALYTQHGWRAFTIGATPRIISAGCHTAMMMTMYELLKRFSVD